MGAEVADGLVAVGVAADDGDHFDGRAEAGGGDLRGGVRALKNVGTAWLAPLPPNPVA
jgi:hypothetical protein